MSSVTVWLLIGTSVWLAIAAVNLPEIVRRDKRETERLPIVVHVICVLLWPVAIYELLTGTGSVPAWRSMRERSGLKVSPPFAYVPPNNKKRIDEILALHQVHPPRFHLAERVRAPNGENGLIDTAFVDLQAAMDAFVIPKDWYEMQETTPTTPKSGRWYSVVLENGCVLVGEDDLEKP